MSCPLVLVSVHFSGEKSEYSGSLTVTNMKIYVAGPFYQQTKHTSVRGNASFDIYTHNGDFNDYNIPKVTEESISSSGSQDLNFFHLQNRVINSFYDYNWNTTILKFKVYLKK